MIEELYRRYHAELLGWCESMTQNRHTAEELVQEAFLRAMLQGEVFQNLKEHQQRAWLYRTIKNMFVDRVRHTQREAIVEVLPEQTKQPEEMTQLELEDLLDRLPDQEGVVFALRYLEGYTSAQIGELLSMPPGTVRYKLSLAREHIKRELGGK